MKRYLPRNMANNIWIAFALFVPMLIALCYEVFGGQWSSSAIAAWVQAFGAILAIIGAAAFPYFHEAEKERRKSERLRKIIKGLADSQRDQLGKLYSALYNSAEDWGEKSITPYIDNGWHLRWPSLIEALGSIPISDLSTKEVELLGELKIGAAFAGDICKRLESWEFFGSREQFDIKLLKHHVEMANLVFERIGDW